GREPGWVYPSIVTGSVTAGNAEAGLIVWTPSPGMLKAIVSAPGAALARAMTSRREPSPESSVLVTTNVANNWRPSSNSARGLKPWARTRRSWAVRDRLMSSTSAAVLFYGEHLPMMGPGEGPVKAESAVGASTSLRGRRLRRAAA